MGDLVSPMFIYKSNNLTMSVLVPIIDYIDGYTRRVYLKSGVTDIYPIEDIYHEYRHLRRTVEALQKWSPLLRAEGNISKGAGKYTPRYIVLIDGTKIVPFDEATQLNQLGDIITDDPVSDATLYDVSTLTTAKHIFIQPPGAEVIRLDSAAIEHSSFNNKVTIGGTNAKAGTAFPIGTPQQPVNNLEDAKLIATHRGFNTLFLVDSITVNSGQSISNLNLISDNWSEVIIESGATSINTRFEKLSVYGEMSGYWNILVDCWVYDITNFTGWLRGGSFASISLAPGIMGQEFGSQSFFDDIIPLYPGIASVLTMNTGVAVSFTHASNSYEIKSMVSGTTLNFGISEGSVKFFSSCTGGVATITGTGNLIDDSNGTTINKTGFVEASLLQHSAFNGGVTIDLAGLSGTAFPIGTQQQPVNNIPDAVIIATFRGFNTLYIQNNFVFGSGDDISGYVIIGESPEQSLLTFNDDAMTSNINVFNSTITGVFDNKANFTNSHIIDTQFVSGTITNCVLEGDIVLSGNSITILIDCNDGLLLDSTEPSINFNGSGNSLAIRNYIGDITLRNKTGPEQVEINVATGGHITLEDTISNGNIRITGIAKVTDNSSGTTVVDVSHVIFPEQLQLASFGGRVYLNTNRGSSGVKFPIGTMQHPSNNLSDTLLIAESRGLETILVDGTLIITNTDISGKIFIGENNLDAVIVLSGIDNTAIKTTFKNMTLTGRLNGYINVEDCILETISNIGCSIFPTLFRNCMLRADSGVLPALQLSNIVNGQNIHFIDCVSGVPGQGTATLDFNNSDTPIAFRRYGGGITVKNITSNQDSTFEFNQGQIILDDSCTSGKVRLGGIYKLTNNSALVVEERNQSISGGTSVWSENEKLESLAWSKKASDNAEQANLKL